MDLLVSNDKQGLVEIRRGLSKPQVADLLRRVADAIEKGIE